jgi:DNA-formamidopyrimidine glycosylase
MPEGPEVFTIANKLHSSIAGQTIKALEFYKSSCYFEDPIFIPCPCVITQVRYYGKKIIFELEGGCYLVSFLGMVGSWNFTPSKHTCMKMVLSETDLYYEDYRKFGRLNWCNNDAELADVFANVGKDYLIDRPSFKEWNAAVTNPRRRKVMICKFLLNHTIFAGIGNYLRADILYDAKIHPTRELCSLSGEDRERLYHSIYSIIDASVAAGGLTISDYWDPDRKRGMYEPLVYGRDTDDLGNEVVREKFDDQTSHFVPAVQV